MCLIAIYYVIIMVIAYYMRDTTNTTNTNEDPVRFIEKQILQQNTDTEKIRKVPVINIIQVTCPSAKRSTKAYNKRRGSNPASIMSRLCHNLRKFSSRSICYIPYGSTVTSDQNVHPLNSSRWDTIHEQMFTIWTCLKT